MIDSKTLVAPSSKIRMLGVLLCYNDGDLLEESIRYLLDQNHDVIVWDHGSTDETPDVIRRLQSALLETRHIPREFDFYQLYQAMSRHLMENYTSRYDWISWPDQDEFLEGPTRSKSYEESLREVFDSPYNWIQFHNFNFWTTRADDPHARATTERVRHYALFPDCAPRIRAWRSSATNIREFNHNPPLGEAWPVRFNLRHYPMRSHEQMLARVLRDRAGLRREGYNYHYENMQRRLKLLELSPEQLHYDEGHAELNPDPIFNWRTIYGYGPPEDQTAAPGAEVNEKTTSETLPFDDELLNEHLLLADRRLPGPDYYAVLRWIHETLAPSNYIEIGIRKGESLLLASPKTICIGIDPAPDIQEPLPTKTRVFSMTSDAFFNQETRVPQVSRLSRLGDFLPGLLRAPTFDLAFIDGLHLFEQALRDFINLEKFASPQSIVMLHDCLPLDAVTSDRTRTTHFYSGDVWKLTMCLKVHRPDLKMTMIRTGPTGLCLVSNLDAQSNTLDSNYEQYVREFLALGFADYERRQHEMPDSVGNTREEVAVCLEQMTGRKPASHSPMTLMINRLLRRPSNSA